MSLRHKKKDVFSATRQFYLPKLQKQTEIDIDDSLVLVFSLQEKSWRWWRSVNSSIFTWTKDWTEDSTVKLHGGMEQTRRHDLL